MSQERIVEIRRSPTKGFGFSIIGGSNTHLPPMICSLVKDSPAATSRKVKIGDVVEKVNGINARELPTKTIVELVRNSKEKIIISVTEDLKARALARPFLSEEIVTSAPNDGRSSRRASSALDRKPHGDLTDQSVATERRDFGTVSPNAETAKKSSRFKRTVGSPNYDHLGTDGRFCKTGSLDREPYNFYIGCESDEKIADSPNLEDKELKECDLAANDELVLSHPPSRFISRLSNPIFGSAPRLNADDALMKQISGMYDSSNRSLSSRQKVPMHRRSRSHDEQTWNYLQRQQTGPDYRQGYHASLPNGTESGKRSGATVRFESPLTERKFDGTWPRGQSNRAALVANGGSKLVHSDEKLESNPQDLRNAFMKHQMLLQSQKLTGPSQRRYNSNEELPSHDRTFRPIQQNGPVQNNRMFTIGQPKQNSPNRGFIDDNEDDGDLQSSGYGVGFKRTNSLGRADIYQRRIQDFCHTDRTHVNQYRDNGRLAGDIKQGMQIPQLSPAVQQRLRDMTTSTMSSYGASHATNHQPSYQYSNHQNTNHQFTPQSMNQSVYQYSNQKNVVSRGTNQTDNYNRPSSLPEADNYTLAQISPHPDTYNQPPPSASYALDHRMYNGVPMRDAEDGMVHSRYEHGKSLAVPTQQFSEEFFASSGVPPDGFDRNRGSFTSVTSERSRVSGFGTSGVPSSGPVPDDLKSFDATDLATKLFTLDGFTRDEIAPFLGKNTEYSQRVCSEYMKFLNFEGYSIDEALRILLQKFPITGETQERERILIQFSKRYHESNRQLYGSEDAVHTLTCALMLLNTDLHGQNIGNKMTLNDFIHNLSGLCDGKDFSRELLKTLYQSIKNKEIQHAFSEAQRDIKPSPKMRKSSSNGNPFIELKAHDDAVLMHEGMMYRKCIMESDCKRLPAIKRGWKMFYCTLKGLVLFLQKPDKAPSDQSIGLHHALAGFATEYKKRSFVFKLITADWRVFMFQAKSKLDVQDWVDSINLTAAALSSPPLPAPCSSSKQFSRPVMPVSVTRLSLEEQIKRHSERVVSNRPTTNILFIELSEFPFGAKIKVKRARSLSRQAESIDKDMQDHREIQPSEMSKEFKDWENKMDYLEFEYKRFSAYVKVLCTPRLKDKLAFLLSNRLQAAEAGKSRSEKSSKPMRSSSMNDIGSANNTSPTTRRRMRQSYLKAVYS